MTPADAKITAFATQGSGSEELLDDERRRRGETVRALPLFVQSAHVDRFTVFLLERCDSH